MLGGILRSGILLGVNLVHHFVGHHFCLVAFYKESLFSVYVLSGILGCGILLGVNLSFCWTSFLFSVLSGTLVRGILLDGIKFFFSLKSRTGKRRRSSGTSTLTCTPEMESSATLLSLNFSRDARSRMAACRSLQNSRRKSSLHVLF
jgi:hypothetical protein